MYPLNEGDSLAKVTRYELARGDDGITIEVRWYLGGPEAGTYTAAPLDLEGFHVSPALWGEGGTETAALRACLEKIRHLSPSRVRAYP